MKSIIIVENSVTAITRKNSSLFNLVATVLKNVPLSRISNIQNLLFN